MPGINDLIATLGSRLGGTLNGASPFSGSRLNGLTPFGGGALSGASPFRSGLTTTGSPFAGRGFNVPNPFAGMGFNVQSPFQGSGFNVPTPFNGNGLLGLNVFNPYAPKAPNAQSGAAAAGNATGGPSTGLDPGVAKWAAQTQSTFADLGADMPDIMLAIMTNESHGNPDVQNQQGYPAYGLFQLWNQPGLNANQQFAAAHTLAQQKLTSLAQSYAAHGVNPDARTRARDFALAWGGQFDYDTAQPSTTNKDVGSGQTAAQLAQVFLNNYDNIKNGRTQATNSGKGTVPGWQNSITPGVQGAIMQEFGDTDYSASHQSTYTYGSSYGVTGHPGVDWAVPYGTRVSTPVGGTVSIVGNDHGTGYFYTNTEGPDNPDSSGEFAITLDNGDIVILGHMSLINARVGQRLNAGDLIGLSGGSDGSHVHVEYRKKDPSMPSGYRIVDPRTMLK